MIKKTIESASSWSTTALPKKQLLDEKKKGEGFIK